MTKHVLLNNIDHKNLKVVTERSASYGDNVMTAVTFPIEFRNLQAYYPIVFRKGETDDFYPIALLGLERNENLFLGDGGWGAPYIPLSIECQPFLIGFQSKENNGAFEKQPVIHIDMDSPRISDQDGQAIFLEHGGNSEYLQRISSALKVVHEGFEQIKPFVDMLKDYELLESFAADIKLNDGSENRLVGFYTINEEKLNHLSGECLQNLNARGFLKPIFMQIASLSQFRGLIERKNLQRKP